MDQGITKEKCSVSSSPSRDYLIRNGINISEEIEKYLDNLSSKDAEFIDPKLKRERQRLQDLLRSYKKLSEQLDRKCEEASKEGIHVPSKEILARRAEIYALLHPELYKNRREEAKKELIEKISSRRHFTEVDKVCSRDITPIHCVPDKGQQEKDRFCKIVASAPSRFHNAGGEPTRRFSRLTRPVVTPSCHVDAREDEKDRLARIFATSAAFIRDPNLKKKMQQKCKQANRPPTQNPPDSQHPLSQNDMVRNGEYSPLNKYSNPLQGRTVLGVEEHDAIREQLSDELRHENLCHRKKNEVVHNGEYSPLNKYSSTLQGPTILGVEEQGAIREQLSDERRHEYNDMIHNGEYSPLNKYSSRLQGRTVLGLEEHDAIREHLSNERRHECLNHRKKNEVVHNGEYSPLNKYSSPSQGRTVLGVGEHDALRQHLSDERRHECLNHRKKNEVVHNGEYSPLNKYSSPSQGRTVLGVGEHDALRQHLSDERRYEYLSHREKETQAKVDKGVMVCTPTGRSVSSASTQTNELHTEVESPIHVNPSKSSPREFVESSPRDEKSKQIAYAQALQEQIKEKKRLNEERKRLEKEEEELEERRFIEQAERVQKEYNHKRSLKLDLLVQAHETGGRVLDRELVGATSATLLPEQLPRGSIEEGRSRMTEPEGVDLVQEHRGQKEILQLPPVVNTTAKIERKNPKSTELAPAGGYVPSSVNDALCRTLKYRQPADSITHAPLDEEVAQSEGTVHRSTQRCRSPVIPAIRIGSALKRNSRMVDNEWKVPQKGSRDLKQTIVDKEHILTQLGAFRRQLAQEHHKLEDRIKGQSTS